LTTTANSPLGATIVAMFSTNMVLTLSSVTDSAGNTYTVGPTIQSGAGATCAIAYCVNAKALGSGGTITGTWSAAATNRGVTAYSVTGIASVDVVGAGVFSASSVTSLSMSTGALAQANEVIFGALCVNTTAAGAAASGFTVGSYNATNDDIVPFWQIVSSTASVTFNPTWTNSHNAAANLVTFKGVPDTYDPRVRLAYLDF
jgi:hypothetical protein